MPARAPHPTNLRHAMELCLKDARRKHNRSVERVADLMGVANHWSLYKWMESGRLPAILIRPFEHACGAHYVTEYLATSAHRLLVEIPSGRPVADGDLVVLQLGVSEAVALLARFHRGEAEAGETIGALTRVMADLAGHRENVAKSMAPELALFEEEDA
jgi:hypothetical protein